MTRVLPTFYKVSNLTISEKKTFFAAFALPISFKHLLSTMSATQQDNISMDSNNVNPIPMETNIPDDQYSNEQPNKKNRNRHTTQPNISSANLYAPLLSIPHPIQ